eukprot:724478-Prymnesium_polylepis.2
MDLFACCGRGANVSQNDLPPEEIADERDSGWSVDESAVQPNPRSRANSRDPRYSNKPKDSVRRTFSPGVSASQR